MVIRRKKLIDEQCVKAIQDALESPDRLVSLLHNLFTSMFKARALSIIRTHGPGRFAPIEILGVAKGGFHSYFTAIFVVR